MSEEETPEAGPEEAAKPAEEAPKKNIGPSGTPAGKRKKKPADAVVDPRAAAIATAFDAGNFQRVRELAAELAKSDDAALREVASDYATRIAVDPIQIAFLGLCAIALLTIAWIYVPH